MVGVIKEGALFVADAHYPDHGDEFLSLLRGIEEGSIVTPQLFLMGDIFDLLFGHSLPSLTQNIEAVTLIRKLSTHLEIVYFEGNHDFTLEPIFDRITLIPRNVQPAIFELGGKRVALSHGDRYEMGFVYEFYTWALRSKLFLTLSRPLHTLVITLISRKQKNKKICRTFEAFPTRVEQIMQHYQGVEQVIEGHFHQGVVLGDYISLPSLACQKAVARVEEGEIKFIGIDRVLRANI